MRSEADRRTPPSRGRLAWRVAVFELKLALDGLKDLVLAPLALGALLGDFIISERNRGDFTRWVMRLGERFDSWLNLYGGDGPRSSRILDEGGSDVLVDYLERSAKQVGKGLKEREKEP